MFFQKKKSTDPKLLNSSVYCYKIFLFLINAVLFNFQLIKEFWEKQFHMFQKIFKNIEN